MNTTTFRKGIASAFAVAAVFAVTACGNEVAPPAQDIGGTQADKPAPTQRNTSGSRMDFGDENGKAAQQSGDSEPAGSGTRNRMDFRDDGN